MKYPHIHDIAQYVRDLSYFAGRLSRVNISLIPTYGVIQRGIGSGMSGLFLALGIPPDFMGTCEKLFTNLTSYRTELG